MKNVLILCVLALSSIQVFGRLDPFGSKNLSMEAPQGFGANVRQGLAAHYGVSQSAIAVTKIADRSYVYTANTASGAVSGAVTVALLANVNVANAADPNSAFNFIVEDNLDPW